MIKKLALCAACLALVPGFPAATHAGGALENLDITGSVPSPIPGQVVARVIGIRWDSRCLPVRYRVNDTQDPVPNPLGAPFLAVADAGASLQASMDAWNDIRTSYIEMNVVGTVANPGLAAFDFVNEQTFRVPAGSGFIASSPSTALLADSTFADGDDIDGDGDSDVSGSIRACRDVDGDGDIEFPAGTYAAGTILDNDVQYNATLLRFTTDAADIDATVLSVDLQGTATHELGHSHGLAHPLNNQVSAADGTSATMFPFIDTDDADAELSIRSLDTDDVAWSSLFYPEGSARSGPAAVQFGDIPFRFAFGVIEGEVTHGGQGTALAGASVSARRFLVDTLEATAISGTTQLSFDPATGGLFLVSPAFNILDGRYRLPVPLGIYDVGIEAVDGSPAATGNINLTAQIGGAFGQQNFNEEFYDGRREAAIESSPAARLPQLVIPGRSAGGVDFTTNVDTVLGSFGSQDFVGFTGAAAGTYYAVAFPGAAIAAADPGTGLTFHSGLFANGQVDASAVNLWADALLTTCQVSGTTAAVDLASPLRRDRVFVGQDSDFAPFYFSRPESLGSHVLAGIAGGSISHLCLVLKVPDAPFDGPSGVPPLIGLDGVPGGNNDVPIAGLSFVSTDGGATFNASPDFNFRFALVVSELP